MSEIDPRHLGAFIRESNRIEGIIRPPLKREISAHKTFLAAKPALVAVDLIAFVSAVQPDAVLRDRRGLNVYVGNHIPPPGSPSIRDALEAILIMAGAGANPYFVHHAYETLHPFTDGNGRSGRAVWLWQMAMQPKHDRHAIPRGFLHSWYYHSLQHGLPRDSARRETA